ncbi:MAG TPA: threonine aldolase [Marinilabiliales bacterium]|nr:MAG: threonine aldolase [Bacteroidetes bacterium GWA2_40_14]OFX73684.1 MAG: threonine aldolase [Bacteroidetes bacterium GWD2_40_43]OFX89240.1 MAG: threonine aldolase [Bacteroidetes bacterium GWE2_40_63]OFY23866.1 MAG: threonine aldolase [Bacteroidetes bacterium GWF2_40_13]OFZ32239.1 MAG: threonine aldolase [Bacteroidetes bacterium RIFOXYC2_FULL_40_12]HAM97598.1 threonine aldolase [Marinilabiliales bacterium]
MKRARGFASDNNAGIHPQIMEALMVANRGHAIGYGDDDFTRKAEHHFKEMLGEDIDVYFVFNGTGANVLGINNLGSSFHSVICADTAHIQVDECGAPEKFTGMKLISILTHQGKLTLEGVQKHLHGFGFEHHSQPGVISITQPTELGTLYSVDEIKNLAQLAHSHQMYLHLDGARISNAAVALNLPVKAFTKDAGVDVVSFGGTKNGMMYGEAVVFMNPALATNFRYFRKQGMQLASKMRFIGTQFDAFFTNDLWLQNARHANQMAQLLYQKVMDIPGVKVTQPVQANGVFAIVPAHVIPLLQQEYFFYVWDESRNEVRWMCSFDTTAEDVEDFSAILRKLV